MLLKYCIKKKKRGTKLVNENIISDLKYFPKPKFLFDSSMNGRRKLGRSHMDCIPIIWMFQVNEMYVVVLSLLLIEI